MRSFQFPTDILTAVEQLQGRGGAGARGRVDRAGISKLGQALGSPLRAPVGFAAGVTREVLSRSTTTPQERSSRALATLNRTARRVPEVMVKVTGRQNGSGSVVGNFTYISRLGHDEKEQVELLTSERQLLTNGAEMLDLARDWQSWELADSSRRQGATSISMIFSMPVGTDAHKLRDAVEQFAVEEMANRRWVLALHQDKDHPHVHLTVARRDLDGRRFHPDRQELQHYRERFAELLRDRGIEANATPRRARGIVPKADPLPVIKMRENGKVPHADRAREIEARAGVASDQPRDHEQRAEKRQQFVKETYAKAIAHLQGGNPEQRAIAAALRQFADQLPEPKTRFAATVERLREGRALPDNARPDPALERLKARVAARDTQHPQTRDEALASLSGRLAGHLGTVTPGRTLDTDEDTRARLDRLKERLEQTQPRSLRSATKGPSEHTRQIEKVAERVRDVAKDKSRGRDNTKDRGGPAR
ncbi:MULTISPECIES: relaxase/mobilization nuclease domain-containing protein [unclassified Novosphingobium]|uniref:relaxase/mobilization nuclease domain-containing protein n=1 Tax=unclassified Novosphingobium TaxID=2644732 RepID=UPI00146AC663|nr:MULTISPECIES: relaxase/mobilization nuclease domain-containing protein [unclassified Novosphingobium]NMN07537.1 hypothetical protein [Novosphingobium sp. SG919]NMN89860.1 hypothetical protein [Novosphingobium sp. SG916]